MKTVEKFCSKITLDTRQYGDRLTPKDKALRSIQKTEKKESRMFG